MEFLQEINWSPLWISLKTGAVATIIAFFLGIFCARKIMKMKPVSRAIWDGILTMPLVLPPTVAGFFLLLIFSLRRPFGKFLMENFDFKVVQTWKGCVIAAAVIAFPLLYTILQLWKQMYIVFFDDGFCFWICIFIGIVLMTLLTVIFRILKIAKINPVDIIKTE